MSELTFNRIKELLAKKGKQSKELSVYIGNSARTVSTWCTNRNQPPVELLFQIADFLDVEAGELLTLKKDLIPVPVKGTEKSSDAKTSPGRKGIAVKAIARKKGVRPKK